MCIRDRARGMQGRSGFVSGRNVQADMSRVASMQGDKIGSAFGRGLYDIEESIVDKVGAERKYLATLEAQRRSDALKLAGLAGLFGDNEEELEQPGTQMPGLTLPDFSGFNFNFNYNEGDTGE